MDEPWPTTACRACPATQKVRDTLSRFQTVLGCPTPSRRSVLDPKPGDAIREIDVLIEVGVRHFQDVFEDIGTLRRSLDEVLPAVARQTSR